MIENAVEAPPQAVGQRDTVMHPPGILRVKPYRVPAPDEAAVFLRHARVADPNGHALQRELKDVVDRAKHRRQRDPLRCGIPGWELYERTRPGEKSVIVTGSLLQMRFRSRLCSQSRPKRTRCVLRCQVMESVRWNRRSRLSVAVGVSNQQTGLCNVDRRRRSPRHAGQSSSPAPPAAAS